MWTRKNIKQQDVFRIDSILGMIHFLAAVKMIGMDIGRKLVELGQSLCLLGKAVLLERHQVTQHLEAVTVAVVVVRVLLDLQDRCTWAGVQSGPGHQLRLFESS